MSGETTEFVGLVAILSGAVSISWSAFLISVALGLGIAGLFALGLGVALVLIAHRTGS